MEGLRDAGRPSRADSRPAAGCCRYWAAPAGATARRRSNECYNPVDNLAGL